jgi:hypothetical protein
LSHEDRDLAVLALPAPLGDLRVFCARLSACCRLHAMNEPSPRAFARAALVHGAIPGAMDALASGVGALVVDATQPLVAVHACIRAAAGQLRAACELAPPAGSGRPATS